MAEMNMLELPIREVIKEIEMELEEENYDPVIILGKSGVGKTESIFDLTKKLGIGFCEMRLVNMTETDIIGIPKEDEYGMTVYAANALLPSEDRDGEVGILVLDEITSASRTVRASAYQLMDSKRAVGNYKLPKRWKVVALGNGANDGGVYTGMENAMLSRGTGCAYRVEPNLRSWKEWAIPHGVNPTIVAFLEMRPEYLHKMDIDEGPALFPCPRSWSALSKKLNVREEKLKDKMNEEIVRIYASGLIGVEAANQFATFYNYKSKVIKAEDILAGEASTDVDNIETEAMYITVQSLVKELNRILDDCAQRPTGAEDEMQKVCNAINWSIEVVDKRRDYAITLFQTLLDASDHFKSLILVDQLGNGSYKGFVNQHCPNLEHMIDEMSKVLE